MHCDGTDFDVSILKVYCHTDHTYHQCDRLRSSWVGAFCIQWGLFPNEWECIFMCSSLVITNKKWDLDWK